MKWKADRKVSLLAACETPCCCCSLLGVPSPPIAPLHFSVSEVRFSVYAGLQLNGSVGSREVS